MARKSDVGVMSVYVTADTKQFEHGLAKSGKTAKSFSMKVKGSMNSIGSSFTEMGSKITLMGDAMRFVGGGVASFINLFDALTKSGEAAEAAMERFRETVTTLPFGIGELVKLGEMLADATYNKQNIENEIFAAAQATFQEKALKEVERKNAYLAKVQEDRKRLAYIKDERRWAGTTSEDIRKEQRKLDQAVDRLRAETEVALKGAHDSHRKEIIEAYKVRKKILQEEFYETQRLASKRLANARAWDEIKHAKEDAAKAAAEQLDIETKSLTINKERAKLIEQEAKQAAAVAKTRAAMGFTGAVDVIDTALGAVKIADQSRNQKLQTQQLNELKVQTDILSGIRSRIGASEGVMI